MKTIKRHWLLVLLIFILTISASSINLTQTSTSAPIPTPVSATPAKWQQPFAPTSIWNMPIGANAAYVPGGFQAAGFTGIDINLLYTVSAGSPGQPIYDPASWKYRASGEAIADPYRRKTIPIPDQLIVPDAVPPDTPNNASAFLLPDGVTLVQISPLARTQIGGPVYGWVIPDMSIYGDGIEGGHSGSGLSSIGGTIRLGELTGIAPIQHALQLEVWAQKYLSYNNDGTRGYRWPALVADTYANTAIKDGGYGGTNPALEMGALLALPPSVTSASLGLQTNIGQKLFHTLQDYGGYIVDDTAWDAHEIGVEAGVQEEVQKAYGYGLEQRSGALHDDLNKLFTALAIVDNNSPATIGGGGTPRQPLALPICGVAPTSTPTPIPTLTLTPTLISTPTSVSATVDLTAEGTTDWAHWPGYDHKASGGIQISNYTPVGSGTVFTYTNDLRTLTWSDGTLTVSGSNQNGVHVAGINNGFQITAPADSAKRTLKVYVGGWNSGGTLTAQLSGSSAANYVDASHSSSEQYDAVYTLNYAAASACQTLSVKWVQSSGSGNVSLQAATLQ